MMTRPIAPIWTRRRLPPAADPVAAARLIEEIAAGGRAWARSAEGAALLAAIGGNSPFLADLARRESPTLDEIFADGPRPALTAINAGLGTCPPTLARVEIARRLRVAKRRAALIIALADIAGVFRLEDVTAALSAFAEAALRLATAHLLADAAASGALRLPDRARPTRGAGFVVLALGKLGGRELNYSSDIDLVLLHDPAAHPYHEEGIGAQFTRIARALVSLLETRDADGYVFRTDLRLRPDPAATPPSVSLPAAIAYYESLGQSWERAALLKARPVAGDLALGRAFLAAIRPFIWRRGVDFALIHDIGAMRRRIEAEQRRIGAGDRLARLHGHDLKLGQGGIREIEFLVQTLQLVWGGRDPGLRAPATLPALAHLRRAGHLAPESARALAAAYRFLRRGEHRLQMIADRQTQRLPEGEAELARFALFLGFAGTRAFLARLSRHLAAVARHYREVFEAVPAAPAALDFSGPEPAAATLAAVRDMGFARPEAVAAAVRGWLSGRVRALRSARARELLTEMLPRLLAAFGAQADPEAAFARLQAFLERLPAGVQLFSLFQHNPALIARIAAILGAAPALAEHLARAPGAIEGLLAPEAPPSPARVLAERLADADDLEAAIGIIRMVVREENFRLSVALMEGRIAIDDAGEARTAVADAALKALLARGLADHAARFGALPGGAMAVVVLGKAGSREMMAGSDLDLMLIYDHPESATESDGAPGGGVGGGVGGAPGGGVGGARRLPAGQWFLRAAQGFVAALTAPDADGPLYAVDMRLRPSGNKGPVAVALGAFIRYHAEAAWTWERMALTRARVLAAAPEFADRVRAAIADAIAGAAPAARVRADAAAMRGRLARDHPPAGPFDVKYREGGLIEVEFIAQALQVIAAHDAPDLIHPTTRIALARLAARGWLTAAEAETLIAADRLFRIVQEMLRITIGPRPGIGLAAGALPGLAAEALLRAAGALDIASLHATLNETMAGVRALFLRHLGAP
jgi:glutamate-ammonia-ligase adenylyltransferase